MDSLKPESFFELNSFAHRDLFEGCAYVWEALQKLDSYFEDKNLGNAEPMPGVHLVNAAQIFIGVGTVVEPGAYIQGPCIIGPNNTIRHGAYIRGFVVTGEKCVIGHATEVKRSIFLNGAQAPHFNYVGDSILGSGTNLGAGVKLANLRFDHKEIIIHWNGQRIPSRLKKFGAILGDSASLGCNAVTNPGTILGPRARCIPCLNFGGVVPPDTLMKESYVSNCR
jgi:NDP-sugar pyrophosphorylase family protein